ncbi:Transcriptional regulator HosA [Xylophilus ampelinus]|jgi:DNA-binding MarR family transcriptional regulator|nr:Transcriptional regulator HosA [Xylophilus ampelinus]
MSTSAKSRKAREQALAIRFEEMPGALFRRLHQLAVGRFTSEMGDIGLTPIQWSALLTTTKRPGIDQITLSREIFIDPSTIAGVLERLETRRLLRREVSPQDRRVRLLYATAEGEALLDAANKVVLDTQEWLMDPLTTEERASLMELMLRVLHRPE